MTRGRWLALALALEACGKKAEAPKKQDAVATPPPLAADAAQTATVDAAMPARTDVEPVTPPPPPTTRSGKGDCKTEYAPRPTRDPNPMCKVDGGTFTMGEGKYTQTVKLSPYYIDQFEVTNTQVAHYLNSAKPECARENDSAACFQLGYSETKSAIANARFVQKRADGTFVVIEGEGTVAWDASKGHEKVTIKGAAGTQTITIDARDGRFDVVSYGVHDMVGNASELTSTCLAPYTPCTDV